MYRLLLPTIYSLMFRSDIDYLCCLQFIKVSFIFYYVQCFWPTPDFTVKNLLRNYLSRILILWLKKRLSYYHKFFLVVASKDFKNSTLKFLIVFYSVYYRRTRSLNAPSPICQFGPCGRIMKNSAMVM